MPVNSIKQAEKICVLTVAFIFLTIVCLGVLLFVIYVDIPMNKSLAMKASIPVITIVYAGFIILIVYQAVKLCRSPNDIEKDIEKARELERLQGGEDSSENQLPPPPSTHSPNNPNLHLQTQTTPNTYSNHVEANNIVGNHHTPNSIVLKQNHHPNPQPHRPLIHPPPTQNTNNNTPTTNFSNNNNNNNNSMQQHNPSQVNTNPNPHALSNHNPSSSSTLPPFSL